jgi:hypothetical protein
MIQQRICGQAGNDKLLEYFENGTVQLFDLEAEIGEQHDLSEIAKCHRPSGMSRQFPVR